MREILVFTLLLSLALGYRSPSYVTTDKQPLKQVTTDNESINDLIKDELTFITNNPSSTSTSTSSSSSSPSSSSSTSAGTSVLPSASSSTTMKYTSLATHPKPNEISLTTLQPNEAEILATQNTAKPMLDLPIKDPQDDLDQDPNLGGNETPIYIPEDDMYRRRVITYDQRQEGQYNIRADLENFMIVLIPPGAQEGLTLLDLLTKSSSFKRNSLNKGNKRHRYPNSALGLQPGSPKYHQAVKLKQSLPNLNYLSRNPSSEFLQRNSYPFDKSEGSIPSYRHNSNGAQIPDFIEGRTPYHVDISASDDEQNRLHPDRPVDVIPPPYPLAFQQLIKPYHLEAEPTVIQALPPPEIQTSPGNFLETLLGTNNYRSSRAISTDKSFIDNNNLNSFSYHSSESDSLPFYRADLSFGANKQYPPLDVPHYKDFLTLTSSSSKPRRNNLQDPKQELEDYSNNDFFVPPVLLGRDSADFDLILGSGGYIDPISKALLSDGVARCAPGRRRDSYGVCREIEGY